MSSRAHRRLRLPADARTPSIARAAVRQVLTAGGRTDQLDEALLLVSELSTNGVVHAGTAVDVDVLADDRGVTIVVSDEAVGPIHPDPVPADTGVLAERGRGLQLVDQLATEWGTSHHATGKSVWFRLGPPDGTALPGPRPVARPPVESEPVEGDPVEGEPAPILTPILTEPPPGAAPAEHPANLPAAAWVWLVHVPEGLRSRLTMPQLIAELLRRLCEVAGAASGSVWLDRGDVAGERRLAGYSSPNQPAPKLTDPGAVAVPLPVSSPLRGSLVLYPSAGAAPGAYWNELATLSAQRMAIGIDAERLHGDDVRRRGWLAFLAEVSELLAGSLDVELTFALVPQLAVPRLGGWAAVHTLTPDGRLELVSVAHSDEEQLARLRRRLDARASTEVADRLRSALTESTTLTLPGDGRGDGAGVAVPLAARGRALGVLSVGRHADRLHGAEDLAVIADLARRASLAIDNADAHADRIRVAHDLQAALLPVQLPSAPGIEFGAEYVPASTGAEVGGDFYDAWALRRNRWLVSIGDVCGKGTQAAVVTGVVRDVMRALVGENRPLPRMLASLNRTLLARQSDRYATVAVAMVTRLELPGRPRVLEVSLCLAGHDRPILLRADGSTRAVGECGTAVGLIEEFEVSEALVCLQPGDALVFITDGVTERRCHHAHRSAGRGGSRMYGTRKLRALLSGLAGDPAASIAARVRADAVAYCDDPPRDDIAVLVVRNPPA